MDNIVEIKHGSEERSEDTELNRHVRMFYVYYIVRRDVYYSSVVRAPGIRPGGHRFESGWYNYDSKGKTSSSI